MRAALIELPPAGDHEAVRLAGRESWQQQLEFALAWGCEFVIAHGPGASSAAIALRHRAERAGARFENIAGISALMTFVGAEDRLLVMQPGLFPADREALEALRARDCLLTFPAGPAIEAGFERIDLHRAWGGALVLPGRMLDRLADLPEDSAPAPALLRVALQCGVAEKRLADGVQMGVDWAILKEAEATLANERLWADARLGKVSHSPASGGLARWLARRMAGWLAAEPRAPAVMLALVALALGGAVTLAWLDYQSAAFALLALGAIAVEFAIDVARVRAGPFGKIAAWPGLRKTLDIALFAVAAMAIDSLWYREIFAPFVLVASLLLVDKAALARPLAILRDRGLVAAALAIGLVALAAEPLVMGFAALALVAILLVRARPRG